MFHRINACRSVSRPGFAGAGVLIAALALSGCFSDSGNPDSGSSVNQVQISGMAVDGYIAGARVYADLNGNGSRDSFEPRAFTDSYGFFSRRPEIRDESGNLVAGSRDYCQSGPRRHCLRIAASQSETVLRVQGGYDLFTGQPFAGSMRRRIAIPNSDSITIQAITPLTTLEPGVASGTGDYWGDHTGGAFLGEDAVAAVQIHQTVVMVADRIHEELGITTDDIRNELTGELYAAFRGQLAAGGDVTQAWRDLDQDAFQTAISDVLQDLPDPGSTDLNQLALDMASLADVLGDVFDDGSGGATVLVPSDPREEVESWLQAIMSYVGARPDNPVPSDRTLLVDLRNELLALGGDRGNVDFERLSEIVNEVRGGDPIDGKVGGAVIEQVFPELAGSEITVEDSGATGSVSLYFGGEPADGVTPGETIDPMTGADYATAGPLTLCVRGDVGSLDFSDFTDGGSESSLRLTGEWRRPDDRLLVITLSAFDGTFEESASLRLRSGTDADTWEFTLDYDGEQESFLADRTTNDFAPVQGGIPDSHAACGDA